MNNEGIIRTFRVLFYWTLFISFSYLLTQKNEMTKFSFLLFPFIFLVLLGQVYELINGVPITSIFNPVETGIVDYALKETEDSSYVTRVITAPFLNLFCFIASLFFIFARHNFKPGKLYLYTVTTSCFLSILLSATRGWFLAYTTTYLLIFFTTSKSPIRIIKRAIIPLLIFFILYSFTPAIRIQVNNAMVRISTLESLVHGDITLGETQIRTTKRSVAVMDAFYKNPLVGWGFSYKGNHDGHVGNQNLLQSTGVIGYFLFLYFWLFYLYRILRVRQHILPGNPYKLSLLILIYGLLGIFIIHSTSTQIFGYDPQFSAESKIFFLVMFFVFSDIFIKEAMNFDIQRINIRRLNLTSIQPIF